MVDHVRTLLLNRRGIVDGPSDAVLRLFGVDAAPAYDRLSYLQATGTQYIDTGYVHADSTKVDMRIQIDRVGGDWQGLYGARHFSGNETSRLSVWVHRTDGCFCCELGTGRQDKKSYAVDTSKVYDIHLAKTGEESTVSADGAVVVSLGTGTATGGSLNHPDYLFALHQYYTGHDPNWYPHFFTAAKLYSCKIYSGAALERDFVPARRRGDGELGLLDRANGVFYANAGAGTFNAGATLGAALPASQESRIRDAVDRVLPLAMAPDLRSFRRFFDQRVTPAARGSVYARSADELSPDGLRGRVLSGDGWWSVLGLFHSDDPGVAGVLAGMRAAALSPDAPYALGAVLLACAYRRWLLGGEVR